MEITPELIRHLEHLARLELSAEEEARMAGDLKSVFDFFEKLGELDTEGLPELARPVELSNVLRDDEPGAVLSQEEALSVAVEAKDGFFVVPRMIE
ncbi:Aspartyl/glutamyl-tRNA(Asn/Gln) amidotransferase subunit C [Calidithermus terrae]|uniref:Aspartyl/glutamyl-tRNA(Asn/Gln) amidotransferase subunit C n=1 Tax=Calidithermus terrae TaxID=1408545 RepID=A0A399ESH1_9DEIN|nr:Asp-tRNA(Asn)/Glu-tRNA(Gln) amidotransferase subunit GatC [Calidithermus terrae]RIH85999.1 Aspartyl/glutamyl-tRNA(Asn/Gln) amidotransferase subunit C [Calidithermus terrae]